MSRRAKVLRGMPVLRVIAAADMTALQTQPKMNPAVAAGETLLAAIGCVWHMVASFEQVLADGGFDAHVLRYIPWSTVVREASSRCASTAARTA